ncbi:MAG: DUF4112 domain-containing protein [Gemmatimonadaceae bacterium]|nr:DUF4112 domain-containing protein [Gemmatimonadaceae bacterium]
MDKVIKREVSQARALARVLDGLVPLPGGMRVGLDSIVGLLPGIGDMAGAAASAYIVLLAIRAGASRTAVIRMVANIALDTIVGALPILGDLFDLGWQSNTKNVAIMENDLDATGVRSHTSKAVLILIVVGVLVALGGLAYMVAAFLWLVVGKLF